jgi:hypothetical protein
MGYNDGFYHPNDWSQGPNGYIQGLAALRPDLQRRSAELLASLGPRIGEVEDATAARHGWTPDRASRIWEWHPALSDPSLQVNPGQPHWPWQPATAQPAITLTPVGHDPFEAPVKGIRAYHGSPHDFDKFDLSKIGTGEGAQAYGHGLYFAENPAVAGEYKQKLSNPGDTLYVKSKYQDARYDISPSSFQYDTPSWLAANYVVEHGGDIDRALAKAKFDTSQAQPVLQKWKDNSSEFRIEGANPGKTYEVSINADPEHFLDWDKPLSEQPQAVKDFIANHREKGRLEGNTSYGGGLKEPTGEDIVRRLGYKDEAANALRAAGIPGIKYLDQGSRGTTATPTHNYVVFNDKLIDIIKKYGLAGLVAGGAAHFATTPVDHNPFQ